MFVTVRFGVVVCFVLVFVWVWFSLVTCLTWVSFGFEWLILLSASGCLRVWWMLVVVIRFLNFHLFICYYFGLF